MYSAESRKIEEQKGKQAESPTSLPCSATVQYNNKLCTSAMLCPGCVHNIGVICAMCKLLNMCIETNTFS